MGVLVGKKASDFTFVCPTERHAFSDKLDEFKKRNVAETLRMVDALQFTENYGEVFPGNWNHGKKSLKPTRDGLEEFFK